MAMYSAIMAALGVALALTILFVILSTHGLRGAVWTLILILLLLIWAVGLYVSPVWPDYLDLYWVPIIFAGILFSILLIVVTRDAGRRRRKIGDGKIVSSKESSVKKMSGRVATGVTSVTVSVFYWMLMMLFTLAMVVGLVI